MSEQASNPNPDSNTASTQANQSNHQSAEELVAALNANEADAMAALQADLAALQAKSSEMADLYLRAKADAENARRRAEEEVSKARKFAVEGFAESLLPVADSLEAGLVIKDATPEQIREGAQATLRQLIAALERNKVIAINPAPGAIQFILSNRSFLVRWTT